MVTNSIPGRMEEVMKISVSMIVRNERSCIAKALNSVSDADEIIVCDTGSTDDTVEIAEMATNEDVLFIRKCDGDNYQQI